MIKARIQLFLPFIIAIGSAAANPRHIMFAFVDHFEPSGPFADKAVTMWVDDYIAMASQHIDADGRHPIHSYFLISMPAIQPACLDSVLIKLNQATYSGYGEVEYHCHHGIADESKRSEKEATDELLYLISQAKDCFNMHGALITAESLPRFTFGFIHGMWALDNSRLDTWRNPQNPHRQYCGVNRELELLSQQGAYADFTFPATWPMEPSIHDAIFYAVDDNLPASYQDITNIYMVEVNQPPHGDLMIIQGPYDDVDISILPNIYNNWPTLTRMDNWVAHNVHVIGNDDWIFIKVHTHGCARDVSNPIIWDCFFGATMDNFYSGIEQKYNDGVNWKLHYVSAREMYNIIKAAEAGMSGDPNAYRDFLIPPYANMEILTENRYRLIKYDTMDVVLELIEIPETVEMNLKQFGVDANVFESYDEAGLWWCSDATKDTGQFGELHLSDTTPSCYYRIIQDVLK